MMKLYDLFSHENDVLVRTREVLSRNEEGKVRLYDEYKYLAAEYKSFLNEMEVIFSISDNNHKLIKEIQERLEFEIKEKEQKECELEKKIKQLYQYKKRLEGANEKLMKLSSHDELTKLPNRRRFEEFIKELQNSSISKQASIIMADIDFFKDFNDYYGHVAGDKCLKQVAEILLKLPRSTDFVARYGGEEFIVVLPDIGYDDAPRVAERIRENIEKEAIEHKKSKISDCLTVSLGVTTVKDIKAFTIDEIVNSADKMLYQAKKAGRNQFKTNYLELRS